MLKQLATHSDIAPPQHLPALIAHSRTVAESSKDDFVFPSRLWPASYSKICYSFMFPTPPQCLNIGMHYICIPNSFPIAPLLLQILFFRQDSDFWLVHHSPPHEVTCCYVMCQLHMLSVSITKTALAQADDTAQPENEIRYFISFTVSYYSITSNFLTPFSQLVW